MPKSKIILLSTSSFGECSFYASGKEYTYQIDAGHLSHVIKLAKYSPGRALNFVKTRGKLIYTRKERCK